MAKCEIQSLLFFNNCGFASHRQGTIIQPSHFLFVSLFFLSLFFQLAVPFHTVTVNLTLVEGRQSSGLEYVIPYFHVSIRLHIVVLRYMRTSFREGCQLPS
jgi:hypothetical protein